MFILPHRCASHLNHFIATARTRGMSYVNEPESTCTMYASTGHVATCTKAWRQERGASFPSRW